MLKTLILWTTLSIATLANASDRSCAISTGFVDHGAFTDISKVGRGIEALLEQKGYSLVHDGFSRFQLYRTVSCESYIRGGCFETLVRTELMSVDQETLIFETIYRAPFGVFWKSNSRLEIEALWKAASELPNCA